MISMLDKRAQILLKTLIERYIAEGQPIGSRTLSKYSGLDLSPATIRNVMADLEELGFVTEQFLDAIDENLHCFEIDIDSSFNFQCMVIW